MASSTTSNVYIHVIEDVINKVREEFVTDGGPGESVLSELQGLWEFKMMEAGAILGPIQRSAIHRAPSGTPVTPNTVHDLNVPYEGSEEYETPTADMLFPPTPLPGTAQTPLPGMVQTPLPMGEGGYGYNVSNGATPITPDYTSTNENGAPDVKPGPGRPTPYMEPPSSWVTQRPPLDVNVAYVEGREEGERGSLNQPSMQDFFLNSGKRKRDDASSRFRPGGYIPQQDGAGDSPQYEMKVLTGNAQSSVQDASTKFAQVDGPIPDPYDDALSTPNIYNYQGVNEDYNMVNTPVPNDMQGATPVPVQSDPVYEEDDEILNEDDDDDSEDENQGEDLSTTHLVLAQFDKVTRTKSRWKCTLKDGIMHINNKDILFNKATGEFDF